MARSHKNSWLAISLVLVVALLLALTNPSLHDFKEWYAIQNELNAKGSAGGAAGRLLGAIGNLAGKIRSSEYSRTNLGLCSLYQSRDADGAVIHSYLGAARYYVKLK
jgi:hypothetical protein